MRWLALAAPLSAVLASVPAPAQVAQEAFVRAKTLTATEDCPMVAAAVTSETETTVCARRSTADRYRLPLPVDRIADPAGAPVKGEPMSGAAALVPFADCGPFAGQRACSKAEARRYGYGLDPLSLGAKLLTKLFDPDAELGPVPPPPPLPKPKR
ncbi:MAG: hypothetical protein H2054_06355 [Sphingomonas sp.]|uniref:hypothetical protein n=1 Tax=Sphingomonas sp. TaxID=28214 RepID=UPI0017F5191C|nr:hypothetical protein [Zymomonas sp.]MBA4772717.1 hypothetical protein [Sphingomonas sp.]